MSKKKKDASPVESAPSVVHMSLDEIVSSLTLDQKVSLVSGKDYWHTVNIDSPKAKIPSVMVCDGPHGLRKQEDTADNLGVNDSVKAVCFPSAAGLASSFDVDLLRSLGETLGEECQAENVSTLLGPAINIKRSPLCGRNFEYFSEDPYLAGKMASAYINGVQSKNTGVSLKHFAGNNQEKRRFNVSSEIDERALREIYLKAFEIAVKESNPWTLMCSYNKLNGVQVSENERLLNDILRDEWGFKGLVMSDWGAVNDRVKGLKAGLDLEMPGTFGRSAKKIKAAIEDGSLSEETLDKSCKRILNLVFKWSQNRLDCDFDREEHHKRAKNAALKSMVLLKNEDNILPLDKSKKIAFIGEFAKNPRYQGGGSSHINSYKVTDAYSSSSSITKGILYATGFGVEDKEISKDLLDGALRVAEDADIAVIFAGIPASLESESFDRADMRLPECQNYLIERVSEVQKNTVVVLHNGSPVEMPWIDKVKGVLEAYLAGETVGEAESDILFGLANPSGKLAETFPLKYSDTPCYYSFPGTFNTSEYRESVFTGYRYYETAKKDVLFPFGFGLSYTEFKYGDLKLSKDVLTPDDDALTVELTVKNTGAMAGEETVEIYVSPKVKTVFRSDIELKGFAKVYLEPGESKKVSVNLDKSSFSYYNIDEKDFVSDDGEYIVKAAQSVSDIKLQKSVKLEGFGVHKNPYSEEVNTLYSGDVREINRASFQKLLGREIIIEKPERPFTRENCLGDTEGTKIGDLIFNLIDVVSGKIKMNIGSKEMINAAALETPVRTLIDMSNGVLNEGFEHAIVDLINGKISFLPKMILNGILAGLNAIKRNNE